MIRAENIQISPELVGLIGEIDEFKGAWRALGTLAPERLSGLRKVATIESVGSSTRIEGAKLSDREVEELLGRIGVQPLHTRDEQEVAGYADVMEMVFANHGAIPTDESHILQLHAHLLRYSDKDQRHRGKYKTLPNRVEAFDEAGRSIGVIFETSAPFDTPRDMAELVAWYRDAMQGGTHPLIAIGVFVVVFLAIHPFQDGNGRLSRALTTLLLLRSGYAYVPYSSLESIIEQNKEGYYLALRRTQGTLKADAPDWAPWLTYFLRSLQKQKQRLAEKVEREHLLRSTLPELSIKIVELVRTHGQLAVADVIQLTGAPRATAKRHLAELVDGGYLKTIGKSRGTRYLLK